MSRESRRFLLLTDGLQLDRISCVLLSYVMHGLSPA